MIQHENLIVVPWLPSVKISVLVGALPLKAAAVLSDNLLRDASTLPAFWAVWAASQNTALLLNWVSPHPLALSAYKLEIRRYALPKDGWNDNACSA